MAPLKRESLPPASHQDSFSRRAVLRAAPSERTHRRRHGAAARALSTQRPNYSLGAGGFASGAGAGATGSAVVPRSSDGAAQSPAQSLVPLTVPTSLQPIGADGFCCSVKLTTSSALSVLPCVSSVLPSRLQAT